MLDLLKIEWMKLKNYRTFWILSALFLVSIFGINYIVYTIEQNVYNAQQSKGIAEMVIGRRPYSFPIVWQMTSYVSGFLLFLPGLLMIISITNEYSYKTHRQNIIDGWSRTEFISVKIVLAAIAAFLATCMVFITALFFGMQGDGSFTFDKVETLGYFFIQAFSYCMVALLFSIIFKRGGLAIGIFFLYSLVLENLIGGLLNRYANYTGRYLPLESTDNLIPLPLFKEVQKQIIPPPNFTVLFIFAMAYLVIYIYFALRKFKSDDL